MAVTTYVNSPVGDGGGRQDRFVKGDGADNFPCLTGGIDYLAKAGLIKAIQVFTGGNRGTAERAFEAELP